MKEQCPSIRTTIPQADNAELDVAILHVEHRVATSALPVPSTKVREAMTQDVIFCYEDEDIDHVAKNMADIQVRRLPVVNRDKRLVGIIALGDVATRKESAGGKAVKGVSRK
jgi:CBS domain-containing protein